MRVFVFTGDEYLFRKIKYELRGVCECLLYKEGVYTASDLLIADEGALPDGIFADILLHEGGRLGGQFALGSLRGLVLDRISGQRLRLESDKIAVLDGKEVRLTELEHALLFALINAGGEFIDRRTLCETVFGKADEDGMLNLYIHYLRDKLETSGEKVILSRRGGGYRISDDFINGKGRGEAE